MAKGSYTPIQPTTSSTKGASTPYVNPLQSKYDLLKKQLSGLQTRYDDTNLKYRTVNDKYNSMLSTQQADPNTNLKSAVFKGNESNQRAITSFGSMAENLTNRFNQQGTALTADTMGRLNNAYGSYDTDMRGFSDRMGTADQDLHSRNRGQAYAGLDSGFADAENRLHQSLAQRGLSGSGIFAQGMGDLAQDRMRAGARAGVDAYNSAINMSDARRQNRMNTRQNLYGAERNNISTNYGMGMGQLGQNYGSTMAVRGQALQNLLNNNQQRQANLMGYAQLGRGMAGMSNNYLAQAGAGYGNLGGMAGQSAIGLGSNAVGYNTGMNAAQSRFNDSNQGAKGAGIGALGQLGATAFAMSDENLKENIVPIAQISEGIMLYRWDWKLESLSIVGNQPSIGVIAQEVQEVMPEAVTRDPASGYLTVNYSMVFKGV